MAYDEALADRVRSVLQLRADLSPTDVLERKMFGGLAFMVRDHMALGLVRDELMVRVGAEQYEVALARPHARVMDFTGRPMRGMVMVAPAGCSTVEAITPWAELALAITREPKRRKASRRSSPPNAAR